MERHVANLRGVPAVARNLAGGQDQLHVGRAHVLGGAEADAVPGALAQISRIQVPALVLHKHARAGNQVGAVDVAFVRKELQHVGHLQARAFWRAFGAFQPLADLADDI